MLTMRITKLMTGKIVNPKDSLNGCPKDKLLVDVWESGDVPQFSNPETPNPPS